MKFTRLSIVVLLFICSCSVVPKHNTISKEQPVRTEKPKFFVSVPIVEFSSYNTPRVDVDIEGRRYLVKLDLGFRGHISVDSQLLNAINSKSFVGEKLMYGIRGQGYAKKMFRISKLKIGAMSFSPPIVQEENSEFLKETKFYKDKQQLPLKEEEGRLGWELFEKSNLLIDIQHSRIAFCDSLDTLKQEGFAVESFIRAPLLLERGLVEFIAETPAGPLLCMLDTGATWNVLHSELDNRKSIDVAVWESDNVLEYPSFKIEGVDFGPMSFHRMPIRIPIQIEAILGMEFFQDNIVFLDFSEKSAYFLKGSQE